MNIRKEKTGEALTIALEGRLDTTTAPDFEKELRELLPGVASLTLDFGKLEYISSAGLRVLILTQKIMARQGDMKVINVNEMIMEIFEITGFLQVMTVE